MDKFFLFVENDLKKWFVALAGPTPVKGTSVREQITELRIAASVFVYLLLEPHL